MGLLEYPFFNSIQKVVKSWFSGVEMWGCCHDCKGYSHCCRGCGQLFCRKCVHVGFDRPMFCKICSHDSFPDLPLPRFRNSRLAHLSELSNFSSPRSSRSDSEEYGDDSGKNFFSASSELSQDISDVDSVSVNTSIDLQSFTSVNSSPLSSPIRDFNDNAGNNSPLNQDSPSYFRKTRDECENSLENSPLDSKYESMYRNNDDQKVQKPLDFENNELIWDPPLPENEDDDVENGFFGYDDNDEDEVVSDSSNYFSSSSFSSRSLSIREKPDDEHKTRLKNSVHGHFRALVCQLLRGEGFQILCENGNNGWLDIVSTLAWQAASFVKPDISKGSSMDLGNYMKVKCILSGNPSDSTLVKGVVCTKNIKLKRMISQHKSPRLFLLGGALEYDRVTNKLASINAVLQQEIDQLKVSLSKIEAYQPNVLVVEKSVSSFAQDYLLTKEISLVLNVKRTLLERIARCTGAQIAPNTDNIARAKLGHCNMFRVEKFFEECSDGIQSNKKPTKTLMYFEGCPRRLGCTVLLHGTNREELKKVKHVVQYAGFAAYHLSRETSFLVDEGGALPKIPQTSPKIPKTSVVSDTQQRNCYNTQLHMDAKDFVIVDHDIGFNAPKEMMRNACEVKNLEHYKEIENTDYFSTADNQSILVSLSTTCVSKGTICEPPQLLRIKFYGSFDKPLGRYLRDDLFDQKFHCHACKEQAEAHVRCYTHQHGTLTISVHRHSSIKLPGERDGRIWMWHRCLKCECNNGVLPAACRVTMSDAAWSLSFGKFLELSFSNQVTANRVASCGHSLQKDCLRFYGSGSMVALFRYSPVDILSVKLPPFVLDFVCERQREWAKEEAADIMGKIEFLHAEVIDVLQGFERRFTTSDYEPLKTSIHKYIIELKNLLAREKNEYDVFLVQETVDILEFNRLRRFLLIDSHMWERRLCLLDSFSKSKTSTSKIYSHISNESANNAHDFRIFPEEDITCCGILEHDSKELIESDSMNRDSEASIERLPSAGSILSDKIDSLWSGNRDFGALGSISILDNPTYRKVASPLRVSSFDSVLRYKRQAEASLHLNSFRSFDASRNSGSMNISQISPKSKKANGSIFISTCNLVDEGARFMLPQNGNDDLVVVLYDNEPSTVISYAISTHDHADFVAVDCQLSEGIHFKISFDESSIAKEKMRYSVTCYFAKQFAALRKKCCPNEEDFLRSLSRCKRWNAQGGKSNVYFAKSFDERFIIKQVTKTELDSFELFASGYFKHMTESLNTGSPTCLAKCLGVYQVCIRNLKGGREVKMELMVMENLFFGRTISKVYDLKGSLRARYNSDTSGNDSVLLDANLLESLRTKPIFLGSKAKRRLERAVWNDTSFLASVDVMDYSLLVGIDAEKKELVIGIIDFMRQYTWDKHFETWVKLSGILGGPKNESPTVISPLQYKRRFRKAMSKYFLTVPDP